MEYSTSQRDFRKKKGNSGEPCALKGASTVRRGEVRKGLSEIPPEGNFWRVKEKAVPRWPLTLPDLQGETGRHPGDPARGKLYQQSKFSRPRSYPDLRSCAEREATVPWQTRETWLISGIRWSALSCRCQRELQCAPQSIPQLLRAGDRGTSSCAQTACCLNERDEEYACHI